MKLVSIFFSRQFLLFLVFGGLAALVSIMSGWFLYRGNGRFLPYPAAVFAGATAAIAVNFGLNYAFNFHFRGRGLLAQLQTFTLVAVAGVFLTAFLAWFLLHALLAVGMADWMFFSIPISVKLTAHVAAVGLVTIYSYLAHKHLSFNEGIIAWWRKR